MFASISAFVIIIKRKFVGDDAGVLCILSTCKWRSVLLSIFENNSGINGI